MSKKKTLSAAPLVAASTQPAADIADLEPGCLALSQARHDLAAKLVALNAEMETLRQRHGPDIIAALRNHNTLQALLMADVARVPKERFAKPRTAKFHGIEVGLKKGTGSMAFQFDDARTIALIEKHFPDKVGVLVHTKRSPDKEGFEGLSATDLAKVGATIVEAGDKIVCKPIESDVEKLIKALAKNASGLIDPTAEHDAGEGA